MADSAQMNLGKYQLLRKLATGGMAEVYLARIAGPGGFEKLVVLKRILPHLAEEATFVSMFRSEAKLAAQLNHPNVVSIFDFGQEGESWYLVMEYIDGPSLRWVCRRAAALARPLSFTIAAGIVSAVCEGLAFAHEFADPETGQHLQLVHRDVSADNILMGRNGVVKVVDFGIARVTNQTRHTQTGAIRGKLSYMSPELIRGEEIDRRADIFALGVVLYELLCGSKPFEAPTDPAIMQAILFEPFRPVQPRRPDLPPELQHVLERSLEKTRDARYQDCREMQADLERFIAAQGTRVTHAQLAQMLAGLALDSDDGARPFQDAAAHLAPTALEKSPAPAAPQLPPPPLGATGVLKPRPDPHVDEPIPLEQPRRQEPNPWPQMEVDLSAEPSGRVFGSAPAPPPGKPGPGRRALVALVVVIGIGAGVAYKVTHSPQEVGPVIAVAPPVAPPKPAPSPTPTPVVPPAQVEPAPPEVAAPAPIHAKTTPPRANPKVVQTGRPPVHPPVKVAEPVVAPPPVADALVDFRVRPYATVLVDGVLRGVTPLAKLKLTVGMHEVMLRNADLGKTVTLQFKVEPGENTLKYNLEAEP